MEAPFVKHQTFEYQPNHPFQIINITRQALLDNPMRECLPHWHSELEMAYLYVPSCHYIDGHAIQGQPGDFIITNADSVHQITVEKEYSNRLISRTVNNQLSATVILIHEDYLKANLPDYGDFYFTNTELRASDRIRELVEKIRIFAPPFDSNEGPFDYLLLSSLVLQLLHEMCLRGVAPKVSIENIQRNADIDRLREILQYMELHYQERTTETEIAQHFFMSPTYFSRLFKRSTGLTFHQYLTQLRLGQARQLLLNTDCSVTEIALSCGFSDSRRLSIAFRQQFGCTPLEYRCAAREKQ